MRLGGRASFGLQRHVIRGLRASAFVLAAPVLLPNLSCAAAASKTNPVPPSRALEDEAEGRTADATPSGAAASASHNEPWEAMATLPSLRRALTRAPSQHFTGDLDGEVLANAEAADYPALGPARSLPPGTTLVETHYDRASNEIVAHFVMVKQRPGFDPQGGDWEYIIVRASGLIEQRGRLPLCARCHTNAPHDYLFGRSR